MKQQNFERELPDGYKLVKHINALNARLGIILNLICLAVLAVVIVIAFIPIILNDISLIDVYKEADFLERIVPLLATVAALFSYLVLHELVHGLAYKLLTGERLTYGISWSCAFCGVPNIYTYRKTALISVCAPLITFSVILIPLTIALYFVSPIAYVLSAIILGLHLGGCSGDVYVIYLLLKFKNKKALMRDTGPEQFFYLPKEENI